MYAAFTPVFSSYGKQELSEQTCIRALKINGNGNSKTKAYRAAARYAFLLCLYIINIILHAHGKAVEPAARKQKYCRFLKFFRVHNLFSKKVLTNQAVGYNINTVVSTQVPRVLIHQN